MKRKTKLATVGCLLLVGVVVAVVITPKPVSVSFIGYTNGGVHAVFQVNGPTNAVYLVMDQEVGLPVAQLRDLRPGQPFAMPAPLPDGTQSWRCCVTVTPAPNWLAKTASRLKDVGVPIPRGLVDRLEPKPFEVYFPEIHSERELARLPNEVGQLRQQAKEAAALVAQTADAEKLQQLKGEAQSAQCINNLKRIGLAVLAWARTNDNIFPRDFISMSNELATPMILFCPADAMGNRVSEWTQLNSSTISYRLENPNGYAGAVAKPLTTCRIHGHTGFSDGSVRRGQRID